MRAIIVGLIFIGCSHGALWAQQEGTYGQYFKYPLLASPAIAGLEDVAEYNGGFRQQWAGISDAPREFFVAAHFRLRNQQERDLRKYATRLPDQDFVEAEEKEHRRFAVKHGVGGTIYSENFGGFNTQVINGFYAVHYPLNDEWKLSFGLRSGVTIMNFNSTDRDVLNAYDPKYDLFVGSQRTRGLFDTDFSTRIDGKGLFLGYTATQLTRGKVFFGNEATQARLNIHHFVMAGYLHELDEVYSIQPTAMFRYVNNLPPSLDVTVRGIMNDSYWAALGIRDLRNLLFMVGGEYMIQSKQFVGMSYPYERIVNELGAVAPSTHEITLSLKFL